MNQKNDFCALLLNCVLPSSQEEGMSGQIYWKQDFIYRGKQWTLQRSSSQQRLCFGRGSTLCGVCGHCSCDRVFGVFFKRGGILMCTLVQSLQAGSVRILDTFSENLCPGAAGDPDAWLSQFSLKQTCQSTRLSTVQIVLQTIVYLSSETANLNVMDLGFKRLKVFSQWIISMISDDHRILWLSRN